MSAQLDLFAATPPPPPAVAAKPRLPDARVPTAPQPDDEADDEALTCAACGEQGAIGEFISHDRSKGALCPTCHDDAEPECSECRRPFWDERGIRNTARYVLPTGACLCYFCCTSHRERTREQKPLTAAEADEAARSFLRVAQWQDEAHQRRALFHLRGGMHPGNRPIDKKGRLVPVDYEAARRMFLTTRRRPLQQLADEFWPLVDAYDRALRAGEEVDPAWQDGMDLLLLEANHGDRATRGGRRDYPGPYRLRALVKWRARREGRLPMWGIEQRFRFTCRGLHVVAENRFGLGLSLDKDRHRPGDLCWSSTGFRSFCGVHKGSGSGQTPEGHARAILEAYIDAKPGKDGTGGLGGKLERWVPVEASDWADRERDRQGRDWYRPFDPEYRRAHPAMTAEADRSAYWVKWEAEADEKAERALAWMQARGVDPYALFPDCKPPAQESLF